MKNFLKNSITNKTFQLLALFTLLFMILYENLFTQYFQGDEWYFFQTYIESVRSPYWMVNGLTRAFTHPQPFGFHFSPLLEVIYIWSFRIFGLNQYLYLITYSFIHILNSFLVFSLWNLLTRNFKFSLLAGLFFLLSTAHHEAFTWISAAPGTTIAVTWILAALISFFKYCQNPQTRNLYFTFLFTFLGLMTKETSLVLILFIPLYYIYQFKPDLKQLLLKLWGIWAAVIFFFSVRLIFAPKLPTPEIAYWKLGILDRIYNGGLDLYFFRYVAFTVKSVADSFVNPLLMKKVAIYFTDMQFPYFNAQKPIEGTNYMSFINGPGLEFISYLIGVILLFISYRLLKDTLFKTFIISYFLLGILPILAITLIFPWWGFSPTIDSRHLYHLSLVTSAVFSLALSALAEKTNHVIHFKNVLIPLTMIFILWFVVQSYYLNQMLGKQAEEAVQRTKIITTLQHDIGTPPQKMIIYTQSNKSYYGFAYWMLPFQTAFSHMLPIIFGKPYNPQGLDYPSSFYSDKYLPTGGLVAQGYFEDQGYAIGYFLEKMPLIKTLEKNNLPTDIVYAYNYDGYTYKLTNNSEKFREEINELRTSRAVFKDWKRYGSKEDFLSFQSAPSWNVTYQNRTYTISDKNKQILTIEVIPNKNAEQFSHFVETQDYLGVPIGTHYLGRSIQPDLDMTHNVSYVESHPTTMYTVAGNNLMFYKFEIMDKENWQLILRTLEFVDQVDEEISL